MLDGLDYTTANNPGTSRGQKTRGDRHKPITGHFLWLCGAHQLQNRKLKLKWWTCQRTTVESCPLTETKRLFWLSALYISGYILGSRMDLISRLGAEMQNRQSYDKMFQKSSGGSITVLFVHEITILFLHVPPQLAIWSPKAVSSLDHVIWWTSWV